VSNVLKEENKHQVIALGRLGWSLRRIQKETGIRRETISSYLKAAGVDLRPPRAGRLPAKPASCPNGVITDPDRGKPFDPVVDAGPGAVIPASGIGEVITDSPIAAAGVGATSASEPGRSPSSSACEAYRDAIELGMS
jgi:hypothetical protein